MSKTVAQLTAEINSTLIDNTTGQITPAVVRQNLLDIITSYLNSVDNVPVNSFLADSGVVPGPYSSANITVNSKGIVTLASNGSGGSGGTPDGTLNVLDFGIINDNTTNNATRWDLFQTNIKQYGLGVTITGVTVASSVFTYANHNFQPGQAFLAKTTLGGIVAGNFYYLLSPQAGGTLTKDTFQLSSTNNELGAGETPVTVTGTGTYSFQLSGTEKISIVWPPGGYAINGAFGGFPFHMGVAILDVNFNGAFANFISPGDIGPFQPYGATGHPYLWGYLTADYNNMSSTTINVSVADAAKFVIGGLICAAGIDLQNPMGGNNTSPSTPQSSPPNVHYFDYRVITGINLGTGAITLDRALSRCYLTTWPIMYSGIYPDWGPGSYQPSNAGAACVFYMHPAWNCTRVYRGIHTTETIQQVGTNARRLAFYDCVFDGRGLFPTIGEILTFERCQWKGNDIEFDKMVSFVGFRACVAGNIAIQSSSVQDAIFDEGTIVGSCNGTPKNLTVKGGSRIDDFQIGPSGFGVTDSLTLIDANIGHMQMSLPFWAPGSSVFAAKLAMGYIGSYTFTASGGQGGVLSQPQQTTNANNWAVPGAALYFAKYVNNNDGIDNIGNPFKVIDIFTTNSSPTNVLVEASGSPANAVVTLAAANNGDIFYFTTLGAWPYSAAGDVIPYYPYVVLNKGGPGVNKFNIAKLASPSSPVQITGSNQTLAAALNPKFNIQTTLKSKLLGNSTTHTVTFSGTDVSWTTHSLAADTPVIFLIAVGTTGVLDTAITAGTPYYVLATGGPPANTFKIATSTGGSAITFNGDGSGTQTGVSNPIQIFRHPCPDMTVINCTGGFPTSWQNDISSMNGAVNEPMYSRSKAIISGGENTAVFTPNFYAWGNLTNKRFITINVIQPYTATGTCLLTLTTTVSDQATLNLSSNVQTIDCTVAGIRTISNSAPTGSVGSDSMTAITAWITGKIVPLFSYSIGSSDPTKQPLVSVEILTDQGITAHDATAFVPPGYHTQALAGTNIITKL